MTLTSPVRLGVVLLPDRVTVAVARRGQVVDVFSIVDAEHPAEALRAELETRHLRPRTARLAIARSLAIVKALALPAAVDGDRTQMVQFELERHMPFQTDDAAFDFVPLAKSGEVQQVLVAACERRVVERALHLLTEAKVRPVSLTVAAHDLVPLLGSRPRNEHMVWLHRAGDTADLLFLAGNSLELSRNVPAADPVSLAAEIRGTLTMLRWGECDAVWVSGDAADEVSNAPALGELGLPIQPPPLSASTRRALSGRDGAGNGAELLAGAVAIGPRAPRLDLLPISLRPRRLTRVQKLTVGMIALTACLGLAALLAPGLRNQRQLSGLDAEIRRLDPDVRTVERLMEDHERKRRLLATAQEIASKSVHPLPLVRELAETLPSDVWLTALMLDQKAVELTGQAATASSLIPLLENSPRLERVEFASPVTRARDKEQFRIRAAWESSPAVSAAPPSSSPPTPPRPEPTLRPRPQGAADEEDAETPSPERPPQKRLERRAPR